MKRYVIGALILCLTILTACGPKPEAVSDVRSDPYFSAQDKLINIDGLNMRYRDEGLRDGVPIVMVHGFTSSLETWDALAENLKNEYRIIRFDLPGHGLTGSDLNSLYTNEETVNILRQFIKGLEVEAPVLIGNSLGGLVSWRLAAEDPALISQLVLISPGGFSINGVSETPVDVPMMVKLYLTKAPPSGVKQATSALFADSAKLTKERLDAVRHMMTRPGNGEAFVTRAANFTLPDPVADLRRIEVPTLIIWGEKDIMVPVTHGEKFQSVMPNAFLKTYANAGHVPQEEIPNIIAADIRMFLEGKLAE